MCWFFIVIKVLMLKWLLASISGLNVVVEATANNYEYGYHPSAEEFDNLLRETHRTWTHDILKRQPERELYRPQQENSVNTFVPKYQYESHLQKYFNNVEQHTTKTTTTNSPPIFSQDLKDATNNNRYDLASDLNIHNKDNKHEAGLNKFYNNLENSGSQTKPSMYSQDLQASSNNNRYDLASNLNIHNKDNKHETGLNKFYNNLENSKPSIYSQGLQASSNNNRYNLNSNLNFHYADDNKNDEADINKYLNQKPTKTPTTTTKRPRPPIFSQDLQGSSTNNRYHLTSNLNFNYVDDDETGNQIYEGEVDMNDNDALAPYPTKPANFPEINLKPIHPNELEKYSLNNLYQNNTRAHFPIYFTNPSTGIVYAITEMGKSQNNTIPRTNGSIPIFITKEQYERDIFQLKQEYEQQCKLPAPDKNKTNIKSKYEIPSSFSRPQKTSTTSSTTMRPQIIRLNTKTNTSSAAPPPNSKLITPLKKPAPVIVRTEITVKDKLSSTTPRPLSQRQKLKNKRKNKKSKPPGHRVTSTTTVKPRQGLLAPGGGPPIVMGKRTTTTRRPYGDIYKLPTQLEKPNFGNSIFSTAPITATAASSSGGGGGVTLNHHLEFNNLERNRRSLRKEKYESEVEINGGELGLSSDRWRSSNYENIQNEEEGNAERGKESRIDLSPERKWRSLNYEGNQKEDEETNAGREEESKNISPLKNQEDEIKEEYKKELKYREESDAKNKSKIRENRKSPNETDKTNMELREIDKNNSDLS
ncbi:general transcriptional corepressor trfA-like, partial [Musca vetustissima]|uniref:general transcriptional corepressor trfA-like n=1 Tax=Musca vetustissima TaxID=27455 RepID=UPI002AB7D37F